MSCTATGARPRRKSRQVTVPVPVIPGGRVNPGMAWDELSPPEVKKGCFGTALLLGGVGFGMFGGMAYLALQIARAVWS